MIVLHEDPFHPDHLLPASAAQPHEHRQPAALSGKSIAQAAVRRQTGCTVIGLRSNGEAQVNPDPHVPLPAGAELLLIGTQEAARRFQKTYGGS